MNSDSRLSPFTFIILTNAGENNRFVKEVIDAKLLPSLICTESPFHFASSNYIKHVIKLIIRYYRYLTNKATFKNRYQSYFLAKKYKIPFFPSYKVNSDEFSNLIKKMNVDAGFVFTFRILDKKILHSTKNGFINFHPSLLPYHRGATPYHWTIQQGDMKSGITFHFIREGIDSGPVIEQYEVPLCGHETAGILYDHLLQLGSRLMVQLIHKCQYLVPDGKDLNSDKRFPLEPAFQAENYFILPEMTWFQMNNLIRSCTIRNSMAKIQHDGTTYDIIHGFPAENIKTRPVSLPCLDEKGNLFIQSSDQKAVCLIVKPN